MRLAMLCLPLLLAACAQQAPRDDGLYRALGAEPGIVRIVEGMLLGSARDPRIARHFLDIDIERLREKLIEQLCFESGGPCVYTGDSMEESHKGLRLTPAISTPWSSTCRTPWRPRACPRRRRTACWRAWRRCAGR